MTYEDEHIISTSDENIKKAISALEDEGYIVLQGLPNDNRSHENTTLLADICNYIKKTYVPRMSPGPRYRILRDLELDLELEKIEELLDKLEVDSLQEPLKKSIKHRLSNFIRPGYLRA